MFHLLTTYWFGYWVGTNSHKHIIKRKYIYVNDSDKYKNNQMEFRFNR